MDYIYLPMVLDFIHIGHLNIIKTALEIKLKYKHNKKALIIIGLVSNERTREYKDLFHTYDQREQLALSLRGIDYVIKEDKNPLFIQTIENLKPKYVIHGDDWAKPEASLYEIRNKIKEILEIYGGILIEPKYTEGVSSTCIRKNLVP